MTESVGAYKMVARIASRLRAGWPWNLVHVAIRAKSWSCPTWLHSLWNASSPVYSGCY